MSTPKRFRTKSQLKQKNLQQSVQLKGNVSLLLDSQSIFRVYGPFKKISRHLVVSYITNI